MNVWIKKTRKRVVCKHCGKLIESGEYQVVCQYFMPLRHSEKTWTKTMHFHAKKPNCWVDRAIIELEMKPYSEHRGRKADNINDDDKSKRQKILMRHASLMQRMRTEMTGRKDIMKVSHIIDLMESLKAEIEPYGGVPESWK